MSTVDARAGGNGSDGLARIRDLERAIAERLAAAKASHETVDRAEAEAARLREAAEHEASITAEALLHRARDRVRAEAAASRATARSRAEALRGVAAARHDDDVARVVAVVLGVERGG